MSEPIYKVYLMKYKESWYKLTAEEQNKLMEKGAEALKQVGAESIIMCISFWSSEEWLGWGVEKYPDIEAVLKHAEVLYDLKWFEYIEAKSYLGTEMPQA
ncbi:MAG: hypothetical protein A2Z71_05945 [Chloroflexi bacterium RBG_13_50_21]|nr:MAG: hypothetical protein A2Z71_05945 [Chloroflexi bacterium RBG_13_50_21]OGO59857.1 MAG: hypothetical protein A2029_00540 [Chloroflexi bacterium RBG_19FT_COMBO_47_9]